MDMPVNDAILQNYTEDVNPSIVNVSYMPSHTSVTKYINGEHLEFNVSKDGITVVEKEDVDIAALSKMLQTVTGDDVKDMLHNMISKQGTDAYQNAYRDVFANYRLAIVQKNNIPADEFDNAKSSAQTAMYSLGARGYLKSGVSDLVDTVQIAFGQNSEYAREKVKFSRVKNADPDFFNKLEERMKKENPENFKKLKSFLKLSDEVKKTTLPLVLDAFDTIVFENSDKLHETEKMVKQLEQQQSLIEKVVSKALKKENLPVNLESIGQMSDRDAAYKLSKGLLQFDINVATVARKLSEVSVQINMDLERAGSTSYAVPLMQQQVKVNGFINSMLDGKMSKGKITGLSMFETMIQNVPDYMKDNKTLVRVGGAKLTFAQTRSPKYKLEATVASTFGEDTKLFETALEEGLRFLPAKFDKKLHTIEAEGNRIEIGKIKDLTSKLDGYVNDVKITPIQRVNETELKAHYNKYRNSIKKQILHEITHHPGSEFDVLFSVEQMVAFENTADNARYDEGKVSCFTEMGKELVKELEKEKKVMKVTTRDGTEILAKAVKKIVIENDTGRSNKLGQNGRL